MGEPKFKMLQLLSVIHQPWHFDSRQFDCRHFDCRQFDCRQFDSTKIQNATVCELLINGGIMDFSSVIMPHLAEILWKQDVNSSNGHLRRSC